MSIRSKLELELGVDMVVEFLIRALLRWDQGSPSYSIGMHWCKASLIFESLSEWRSMWVINNE